MSYFLTPLETYFKYVKRRSQTLHVLEVFPLCWPNMAFFGSSETRSEIYSLRCSIWGGASPFQSQLVKEISPKISPLTKFTPSKSYQKSLRQSQLLRNRCTYYSHSKFQAKMIISLTDVLRSVKISARRNLHLFVVQKVLCSDKKF